VFKSCKTPYKGIFDFVQGTLPAEGKLKGKEDELLGSVIKKRRKKMRKHKHKKLLSRSRHKRK